MKKILALLLSSCMLVSMTACGKADSDNNSQGNHTQSETTQNETQQNDVAEVETVQYWLNKIENPSQVLLSSEEIEKQNALMMQWWGTDWKSGYYDINVFPETVDKDWLQERIDYPHVKDLGLYCKGEKITAEQWQERYENYNFEAMPATIAVRYGVIVHNTPAFDFPTNEIHTGSNLDESENLLQQSYFRINEPVVVLWESADAQWYYVVANEFIGWIEAKDCALFDSRKAWSDFQQKEEFLVVKEDTVIEGIEGTVLMSTKLYLVEENEAHDLIHGDYIIRVPQRGENGKLHYTYAAVSKEDKVHEGYLPYTSQNVLTLAFQEMGEPYGWGGIDGKRDCSLYIKHVYDCFGFQMPRNSRSQMSIPEMKTNTSDMSVEEREALLAKTNPGAILGISGHVMLYLGEADGQYYVISMLGSYIPETVTENFAEHVASAQKVIVNTLDVRRKNGNTWLQEILSVVDIK